MKKLLFVLLVLLGLQTQAQISPCDSVEYAITSTVNNNVLQLEGWVNGICPVNFPCVVSDWSWSVCDDNLCYGDTGVTVYFQQFMTTDTIKVCLTTTMTIDTMTYSCMQCDSLVFGPNGWMVMSMGTGTGTSLSEIEMNTTYEFEDNRMFDVLGREFERYQDIPYGTIYIRNRNKFLKTR